MSSTSFTMRQLLEAGVHFGHHTRRWNPKMKDYIFGVRNNTHILDLRQSVPLLHRALEAIREVTASGGRVLLVGTKRQAAEKIADTAQKTGQYFVNHRWLGGMLTNWKTISNTIARLKSIQETLDQEDSAGLTKKELLKLTRERDKLELSIGGIKNMGSLPDLIFVIDTVREQIAIKEANKLNIPIAAIIDTNSDPEGITYPIPGNDDSTKSIRLYCDLMSQAALDGISVQSQKVQEEIVKNIKEGATELEIAITGRDKMEKEIAKTYPDAEYMDTWVWFQSGINTDGAHNPKTNRKLVNGDILSLNTFPMISGYYTALERTLFLDNVNDESLKAWEANVKVHKRGLELIKPGVKCSDICNELNELFAELGYLQYRTFGYGHSFGVLSHFYGREAGLELREDIDTVLEENMVISMEPMILIPEGNPGAGGYREHDILVIGKNSAENITKFPFGPEHNVIKG